MRHHNYLTRLQAIWDGVVFFKAHSIHPAEFLHTHWAYEHKLEKLIDWLIARRGN